MSPDEDRRSDRRPVARTVLLQENALELLHCRLPELVVTGPVSA
jgi:hypothetical protein